MNVLKRAGRWLAWGVLVVLQAMTPFMHVHASPSAAEPHPAGFLHFHVAGAAGHALADAPHVATLEIAPGILPRVLTALPAQPVPPSRFRTTWMQVPVPAWHHAVARTHDILPDPPRQLPPSLAPPVI